MTSENWRIHTVETWLKMHSPLEKIRLSTILTCSMSVWQPSHFAAFPPFRFLYQFSEQYPRVYATGNFSTLQ
jgi:hypothetical protein